jgi:acyl-CoA synthetase (NDP forming)
LTRGDELKADLAKLERAFNPRVLAVVGDSGFFQWLRASENFEGKLYSVQVNPKTIKQIEEMGIKNYTSLLDIPEPVDFVIVAVGRKYALQVLEDCIRKDVAAAHFFTAGFTETDTEDGADLERALTKRATEANFHLIGPNCMGIFNPAVGLKQALGQYDGTMGPLGFISQSGTHAINFSLEAHLQGVDISKSVSFGNGTVLDSAEYLDYFGRDDSIKVVGMYLEGTRDGQRLLEVLREVSLKKPVVIWKGGRTEGGSRAVASHTGSLAVSQDIWTAAMRQGGAIPVLGIDELIDTLKALLYLKPVYGNRVVLAGGSGGQSVAITDAFTEAGLEVPSLSQESFDKFEEFFTIIGGSYRNPIDTGNPNRLQMERIMGIIEKDTNTDNIVMLMNASGAGPPGMDDQRDDEIEAIAQMRARTPKPVMVCLQLTMLPRVIADARTVVKKLQDAGVPAFTSLERGALALKNALDYYQYRQG